MRGSRRVIRSRNDLVEQGECPRLACRCRRPAGHVCPVRNSRLGEVTFPRGPVGEPPTGAAGPVAVPLMSAWLRMHARLQTVVLFSQAMPTRFSR